VGTNAIKRIWTRSVLAVGTNAIKRRTRLNAECVQTRSDAFYSIGPHRQN